MTRFKYALLVGTPALMICWPVGKSAKAIERAAQKVRLKCAARMRRVIDGIPPKPQADGNHQTIGDDCRESRVDQTNNGSAE